MKWLLSLAAGLLFASLAFAQTPAPATEQKIDDFVRLLQDPDIQAWLDIRKATPAEPNSAVAKEPAISAWENSVRTRLSTLVAAVPNIPSEAAAAIVRTRKDAAAHGQAPVFIIFAGLVAFGLLAESLYRGFVFRGKSLASRLAPVGIFSTAMAVVFFAVEWPPLARITLLAYLAAFVAFRVAYAVIGSIIVNPGQRPRLQILAGILCFAVATAALGDPLGISRQVSEAASYCFSIVIFLLVIEAVWSTSTRSSAQKAVISVFVLVLWVLWCLALKGLFWIGVYVLVLPGLLNAAGSLASAFAANSGSLRNVLVTRGARAVVVGLAVAWLALVWQFNPDTVGQRDPWVAALFYGGLKSVLILVAADFLWQVTKNWIDRGLQVPSNAGELLPADAARRARYRTLLPIFRNVLAVVVAVMAGMIVLAQLGVEIGPLIAGAGIFGVALGFGSQSLVKDVISGVFYMLDDAFRVGEYIQAKTYKGTVEGFSLRSVRLRHHRGPVFTVPFGELGAIENMSRDWVIDKFRISVGFNTDIDKARKLTKKVGVELKEDPELGKLFIEPLKMKGVEEFGDYGIVLSFAMTTVPGMQTCIRRKAYARIREVFLANGIDFAQPTVQVGGDDKGGAAAAATAIRSQQNNVPVPAA